MKISDIRMQRAIMSVRPFDYSGPALAALRSDLLRRSTSTIPNELGALLTYKITMVEIGQLCYRRHTYLFEAAVVVMDDGDRGFTPILVNRKLNYPFEIFDVIYFRDITTMVPCCTSGGGIGYIYGLKFKRRNEASDLTLGFDELPAAISWLTEIRRLQCRNKSKHLGSTETATENETEDIAAFESFAAIMQKFRWQIPVTKPLGRVVYQGLVTVNGSMKADGFVRLVLFDTALVFFQGYPQEVKRHLVASRIMSIVKAAGKEIIITYGTEFPYRVHFEEFRFQPTDSGSDVATWLHMLWTFAPKAATQPDVKQKLRRLSQISSQSESTPLDTPETDRILVAGLATLHATLIPHELNISIAVLPAFQSDNIATHLISHVLDVAFEKLIAHRVQARVVHSSTNPAQTARVIRLLLHLGFAHEGIRRRAAIHPTEGQWADVSVLAMLALDWVRRAGVTPAKGTLWDEMFLRHQREREILLKLEGSRELKRTRSMETVRDLHLMNDAVPSASMVSSSVGYPTATSDTSSQSYGPTETSSWDRISDNSISRASEIQHSSVGSISADEAADECAEWDLEEDYSDDEESNEIEPKR